jgi:hypothetical protein
VWVKRNYPYFQYKERKRESWQAALGEEKRKKEASSGKKKRRKKK